MDGYDQIPTKNIKSLQEAGHDVLRSEGLSSSKADALMRSIDKACQKLNRDLDYIKSLPNADAILTGASLEHASLIVESLGKSAKEGRWYYHSKSQGEYTYPFVFKGGVIYPVFWINRRIYDKSAKSIPDLYEEFAPTD